MTKDWGEHTAVHLRPVAWWQAQAAKVTGGRCLKCRGVTDGVYVPPTREAELECAVAEHCRTCGWETGLVRGRAGGGGAGAGGGGWGADSGVADRVAPVDSVRVPRAADGLFALVRSVCVI